MAAKRKKKKNREPFFGDLSPQAKQAIGAVIFGVLGIFFVLSWLGTAGIAGEWTYRLLTFLFGAGFIVAPIACALYVYTLLVPREDGHVSISKVVGISLLIFSVLGLLSLYSDNAGGIGGMILEKPFTALFGGWITGVILVALVLISLFLTFNMGIRVPQLRKKEEPEDADEYYEEDEEDIEAEEEDGVEVEENEEDIEAEEEDNGAAKKSLRERVGLSGKKAADFLVTSFSGPYDPPPLSLLQKDGGKPKGGDIKANSNIIKRTLKNFNIDVEMDEIKVGPTVTQYAIKPAEGVRISKIVGLQSNLELALAASPIRIEAPIPGKSLVGIEVPNTQKQTIGLASLLTNPEFTDSPEPLLVALGKDITGHAQFSNIRRMPHALIAGATNSGKSVTIHNLIASLLFRNSPDQLRLLMVDPKRVELTLYDGIPHLLVPVITDAKKTLLALKWAIKEMERRYDILQEEKIQEIQAYHTEVYEPAKAEFEENGSPEDERENLPEPLPFIVVVIDELSDLMSAYPRELEALIVRLTQKSRAVGIHLLIATQRPEVKVITGLIKANMPCRVALRVNSQIDSRTILDSTGAEKLLGYGDMLYLAPDKNKPQRLQSAFVTTDEIKKVVKYLKNQSSAQELNVIDLDGKNSEDNADAFFNAVDEDDEDEDDLYEEARDIVINSGKASTSYLQRRLRIGYSRAARLMDILEDKSIIGPANGSKPRDILVGGADNDNEYNDDDEEDESKYR